MMPWAGTGGGGDHVLHDTEAHTRRRRARTRRPRRRPSDLRRRNGLECASHPYPRTRVCFSACVHISCISHIAHQRAGVVHGLLLGLATLLGLAEPSDGPSAGAGGASHVRELARGITAARKEALARALGGRPGWHAVDLDDLLAAVEDVRIAPDRKQANKQTRQRLAAQTNKQTNKRTQQCPETTRPGASRGSRAVASGRRRSPAGLFTRHGRRRRSHCRRCFGTPVGAPGRLCPKRP